MNKRLSFAIFCLFLSTSLLAARKKKVLIQEQAQPEQIQPAAQGQSIVILPMAFHEGQWYLLLGAGLPGRQGVALPAGKPLPKESYNLQNDPLLVLDRILNEHAQDKLQVAAKASPVIINGMHVHPAIVEFEAAAAINSKNVRWGWVSFDDLLALLTGEQPSVKTQDGQLAISLGDHASAQKLSKEMRDIFKQRDIVAVIMQTQKMSMQDDEIA